MNNAGRLTCAMTLVSLVACSSPSITNVSVQEPTGGTTGETATGGATAVGGTSGNSTISSVATGGATSNSQATGGASAGAATGGGNNGGNVATGGTPQGGTTSAPSSGGAATGGTATGGVATSLATGGVSPTGGRATDGGAPTGGRTGLTLTGGTSAGPATGGAAAGGRPPTGGATSGPATGGSTSITLTLLFAGKGSGTVTITPGNTVCTSPTTCTAAFASGTAVTLTAKPTNAGATVTSVLGAWQGTCSGISRVCSFAINSNTNTTARFEPLTANLVFASSATFLGNLGGAAAYQTQCNKLATNAGINNATGDAYIAWMAASNYAPVTLLGSSRGWVRMDQLPWIDDMTNALASGAVYYPVAYDENGLRVIGYTFSGMNGSGALDAAQYACNDWSDTTLNAHKGHTHAGAKGWPYNNVGISSCNVASRVLCVMKGMSTPVSLTAATGKKIYLTKSAWVPGGGLAAADTKCMTEAPASVTSAKAILVASTRALTDVLGATTVYVRPDGVRVGSGAEIAQAMNVNAPASIESAVVQYGSGAFVDPASAQLLWTGVSRKLTPDKETCNDWTSNAATDAATGGGVATGWVAAGNNGGFACNNSASHVYLQCAEQ
jgi:hypothetical protein